MNSAIERLLSLRARDVMNPLPVELSATQPLSSAAEVLDGYKISGAPVVDNVGRCIGVLSTRDIVRYEISQRDPEHSNGEPVVGEWMTKDVATVDRDDSMTKTARMMRDHHIHRIIVVNEFQHPIGVVSSLDLTTAMIHAIDE